MNRLKRLIRLVFPKSVHIIGDSHSRAFLAVSSRFLQKGFKLRECIVDGASNMELANPRSNTNAGNIFISYINRQLRDGDAAILWLGEVDCGYVIWYRARKYGLTIEEQARHSLVNYKSLILAARKKSKNIMVISVPMPTIAADQLFGEVALARKGLNTKLEDRVALTFKYNDEISNFCITNGIAYINLTPYIYCNNCRSINNYFLNKDPCDHHLDPLKTGQLLEMVTSIYLDLI